MKVAEPPSAARAARPPDVRGEMLEMVEKGYAVREHVTMFRLRRPRNQPRARAAF